VILLQRPLGFTKYMSLGKWRPKISKSYATRGGGSRRNFYQWGDAAPFILAVNVSKLPELLRGPSEIAQYEKAMTYAETVFLFVSVIGFSGVWYLLYSVRQELEAIRHLLGRSSYGQQ
jgi:hypothetical protein